MPLRRPALATALPERLCPWLAALLILAAAASHLVYLYQGGPLDLSPDEAHYWDWSRHLDWSYYSKGPLVAWLIRLSCELVGGWSERVTGSLTLAVRLPAVVCGSLLLTSLYVLAVEVFGRPRLGLALVAGALTMPLIAAGSFLMTIDSPYTCCWGWALVFAHRAVTRRSAWAWPATGLMVGLGFLAKYTMVIFPASLALFLLFSRERRHLLWSGGFVSMAGVALLCCLPIAVWNAQHDWVTVRHVMRLAGVGPAEKALRGGGGLHWVGPLQYLGGQAALLLGYWFVVWLVAMVAWNPLRQRDEGTRYLWWMSAPVFLLFFAFSLKTKGGEPNWPVTAYLSGGVLAAAWLANQLDSPRVWYRAATAFAVAVTLLVGLGLTLALHRSHLLHPLMARVMGPPSATMPYPVRKADPTCRLRGWRHLAASLDGLRERLRAEDGDEPVLAGVSWSLPGALGVYCDGHPQAYSVGLMQGDRHSQYDFWANPIDHKERFLGRTFVIVGPVFERVREGFETVQGPVKVEYEEAGRPLAGWDVYVCRRFKGFPPPPEAAH
jgi:hypothetical protein